MSRPRARAGRLRKALWSCAAFFALGYFPTTMLPWGPPHVIPPPTTMPATTAPASAPASLPATQPAGEPLVIPGRSPMPSMVLMALAIIPYGSTAGRVRQGLLRGLALGAVGGVAIFAALVYQHPISRGAMAQALWVYVVATAALCAAVAAGFAHLAVRRRQWMDDQWK